MSRVGKLVWVGVMLIIGCFGLITGGSTSKAASEAVSGGGASVTPVKSGLIKEKGSYYYYIFGERVKNTLIKTGDRIYYFGSNGKALKKRWKGIDGDWYYFKKNCRAAIGSVSINKKYRVFNKYGHLFRNTKRKTVKVNGTKYLIDKNGYALKGWFEVGEKMLHTRKNGSYDKRKRCGYIPMNKKGYAKNAEQVRAMLLARKFIKKHTSSSDSAMEKFRKCFKQIVGGNVYVGDWRPQGFGEKGWQYRSAIEMFSFGLVGDCYGISCAVAACAKDLGFQPYVIWAAHSHAFVMVDGKYYDNMHGAVFGTTTHEPYVVKEKFKF